MFCKFFICPNILILYLSVFIICTEIASTFSLNFISSLEKRNYRRNRKAKKMKRQMGRECLFDLLLILKIFLLSLLLFERSYSNNFSSKKQRNISSLYTSFFTVRVKHAQQMEHLLSSMDRLVTFRSRLSAITLAPDRFIDASNRILAKAIERRQEREQEHRANSMRASHQRKCCHSPSRLQSMQPS